MSFARIALDATGRAIGGLYEWHIPPELEERVEVGSAVMVEFNRRLCGGYVLSVSHKASGEVEVSRIKDIRGVLAAPAFDASCASCALWIAREYGSSLIDAVRLFLPPGQKIRVKKGVETPGDGGSPAGGAGNEHSSVSHPGAGSVRLICEQITPKTCRRAHLTEAGMTCELPERFSLQRLIQAALSSGPRDVSELTYLYPGAASALKALEKRGLVEISSRRSLRAPSESSLSSANAAVPLVLTHEQHRAVEAIVGAVTAAAGEVLLLDGVTGSGKTEVYLVSIQSVLDQGKSAIVLVPEIALTPQTVGRFRSRFGDLVALLHSRLSVGERFDQWDRISTGAARVVVGTRSALFAPVRNLGLIVIDEEHDGSYKQDASPRYHAREVACHMALEKGCAVVLGSATPSLESLYRAEQGIFRGASWKHLELRQRPAASSPQKITVVDMCEEFRGKNPSIFSRRLTEALLELREKRQKAVLLLNRRGFATFMMCRECGCVPQCPTCSTSLTYHERERCLMCHSCGKLWPARSYPDISACCPACGSRYMAAFGVGTQRVEDELIALLGSEVDVIRMDFDTTRGKDAHQKILERFDRATCAVLLGTQMIAKGMDFPEVTLVGVINADSILKLPDLRAAERTYELLEQVAGRAGRGAESGEVIIQSYWAHHPAIEAVARGDRQLFLESELEERREAGYPPFARVSRVLVRSTDHAAAERISGEMADILRKRMAEAHYKGDWELLGPADCVKARLNNEFRRNLLLKSPLDSDPAVLLNAAVLELPPHPGVKISLDVDAWSFL